MRSLTLLLIPLLLFMTGCTIDWNDEKNKKITELEKQNIELKAKNDDDLFKKNMECSKKDLGNTEGVSNIEVFYSPKNKSCISVGTLKENKGKPEEEITGFVGDILTHEFIFMFSYKNNEITFLTNYNSGNLSDLNLNEGKCIFNKKVNELKQRNKEDATNYFQDSENCN